MGETGVTIDNADIGFEEVPSTQALDFFTFVNGFMFMVAILAGLN